MNYIKLPNNDYDYSTKGWGFEEALDAQLALEKAKQAPKDHSVKEMVVLRANALWTKFVHFLVNGTRFEKAAVNAASAIEADIRGCEMGKLGQIYPLAVKLERLRSLSGTNKQKIQTALEQIDTAAKTIIDKLATTNTSAQVSSTQISNAAPTVSELVENRAQVKEACALLYTILKDNPIENLAETFLHSWSGNEAGELTSIHVLTSAFGAFSPLRDEFREIVANAKAGAYESPADVQAARTRALALVERMLSKAKEIRPKFEARPDKEFNGLGEKVVKIDKNTTYNIGDIGNVNGTYKERVITKPAQIVQGADGKLTPVPPEYGWKDLPQQQAQEKLTTLPQPGELASIRTKTTDIDLVIRNLETAKRLLQEFANPIQPQPPSPPSGPNPPLQNLLASDNPNEILQVIDSILLTVEQTDEQSAGYDAFESIRLNMINPNYQIMMTLLNKCDELLTEAGDKASNEDTQLLTSCRERLEAIQNRINVSRAFEDDVFQSPQKFKEKT